MSEHMSPIPSMIYNAAVGGHVTNSQQIIDEDYNLEQKDINKETLGVPYNASNPNGMGKIVLKKNDNFKQVVEAQTNGNTIFVIKYDFTLTGNVTVPANCVLEFDGGSVNGTYTITGTNTGINAGLVKIFNTNVTLAGTWNIAEAYPEWFGAKGDGVSDDRIFIQKALDFDSSKVVLLNNYLVVNSLFDYAGYSQSQGELDYIDNMFTQYYNGFTATPLTITSTKIIDIRGKIKQYSPLCNLIEVTADNVLFTGGGTIEGPGYYNTVNGSRTVSGTSRDTWICALINIIGSNNVIDGIKVVRPVNVGINVMGVNSSNNKVNNCTIGGGLPSHTQDDANGSFTMHFGIRTWASETIVENNIFTSIDGGKLYSGVFAWSDNRKEVALFIQNNTFENCLEHGVYSYSYFTHIIDNTFINNLCDIQVFASNSIIHKNIINKSTSLFVGESNQNAIHVQGYADIQENKIYNCIGSAIICLNTYNEDWYKNINIVIKNNHIEKINSYSTTYVDASNNPIFINVAKTQDTSIIIEENYIKNVYESLDDELEYYNPGSIRIAFNNYYIPYVSISKNTILNSMLGGICCEATNAPNKPMVDIKGNTIIDADEKRYLGAGAIRIDNCLGTLESNVVKFTKTKQELEHAGKCFDINYSSLYLKNNFFLGYYYQADPYSGYSSDTSDLYDLGNIVNGQHTNHNIVAALFVQTVGTTSQRPTKNIYPGFAYYDQSLLKMIYWTGQAIGDNGWIDANGNNPAQT